MGIDWTKYHVTVNSLGKLVLGRGMISKSGIMKWTSKSRDRSGEIIEAVARKMRGDLDKREDNRPWVGYELERVGKLILIKPGYKFEVKRDR